MCVRARVSLQRSSKAGLYPVTPPRRPSLVRPPLVSPLTRRPCPTHAHFAAPSSPSASRSSAGSVPLFSSRLSSAPLETSPPPIPLYFLRPWSARIHTCARPRPHPRTSARTRAKCERGALTQTDAQAPTHTHTDRRTLTLTHTDTHLRTFTRTRAPSWHTPCRTHCDTSMITARRRYLG